MKYLFTFLLPLFIISCFTGDKKEIPKAKQKTAKLTNDIIVQNIKKTCSKNTNIYDYLLCTKWLLTESEIKKIFSYGKKNQSSEVLNLLSSKNSSWISADIKKDKNTYKIEIHPMSYYYVTDEKGNEDLYVFDLENQKKIEKYFIRILTEDDDDNYEKKLNQIKKEQQNTNTILPEWKGAYSIKNSKYGQLYVDLNSKEVFFYESNLPNCKIFLIPYVSENELYLYFNGQKTNCSGNDTSLINSLRDGDFMFKISDKNGKKYIQ